MDFDLLVQSWLFAPSKVITNDQVTDYFNSPEFYPIHMAPKSLRPLNGEIGYDSIEGLRIVVSVEGPRNLYQAMVMYGKTSDEDLARVADAIRRELAKRMLLR